MENKTDFQGIHDIGLKKLIEALTRQRRSENFLNPGYRIVLKSGECRFADDLNKIYSKFVWGLRKSALNNKICSDEEDLFNKYLSIADYQHKVLECGCGSGRITKYIHGKCNNLFLLDYNSEVKQHLTRFLKTGSNTHFIHSHLTLIEENEFSIILLMENFMGMNICKDLRIKIYSKLFKILAKHGIAIFGIRVREDLKTNFIYQAFAYSPRFNESVVRLYGISINWSINYFITELTIWAPNFIILDIICGEHRPSGGTMYFVVAEKQ